jgi:tRNA-modifying protein YgfZ
MSNPEAKAAPTLDVLRVEGPDAAEFLHGQLTVDLRVAPPDIGAWCDAKGRTRAVFRIRADDQGWALALPGDLAAAVRRDLQVFVLRSKVTLAAGDPIPWDPLAEIRAGRSQIVPATAGGFLPTLLNLDLIGGLNLNKGCYPGQGVINRAHHLGRIKRRTLRFSVEAAAPAPGTLINAGDRQAGTVLYGAATDRGSELLAVVNLSALTTELSVDGRALTRLDLPYAIPEEGPSP